MKKRTPKIRLSKETTKEILTSNLTYAEIADKYNISQYAARYLFRKNPEYTYVNTTNGGRGWSKEDEQYLIDNYKEKGDFEIGKILSRTATSILRKRLRLNLGKEGNYSLYNRPADCWTKDEIDILTTNIDILPLAELASTLNRSLKAVSVKACKLNLLFNTKWSKKEDELLKKYCNSSVDQIAFMLDRSIKGIKHRAKYLNIKLGSNTNKTSIEYTIENIIKDIGIPYKYNIKLGNAFQFRADFVISNIVIEAHGDYWHGNPLMYPIRNPMQQHAVEKDAVKKEYFESLGYKVYEIWESEITYDLPKIRKFINNLVKENE